MCAYIPPELCNRTESIIAFFEHSHDSVFGVVYRPDFEVRLDLHFQNAGPQNEDVAWYALRNAVYAVGCRASAAMEGTRSFAEVDQESLHYFYNAYSVYSDLLFTASGLMAVQALLVMVKTGAVHFSPELTDPSRLHMLSFSEARLSNTCSAGPPHDWRSRRAFTDSHQQRGDCLD